MTQGRLYDQIAAMAKICHADMWGPVEEDGVLRLEFTRDKRKVRVKVSAQASAAEIVEACRSTLEQLAASG